MGLHSLIFQSKKRREAFDGDEQQQQYRSSNVSLFDRPNASDADNPRGAKERGSGG
jgi:hypothetical protein